jgi:hypothetical protein
VSSIPDDPKKAEHKAWVEGKRREVLAQKLAAAVNAGAAPLADGSYIPKDVPWLYASRPTGTSLQERLYCLRQNARRSLPGLIAIEERVRSGKESIEDFPHFMQWLRDFLPLARESHVLGLPAVWEWAPPQDVVEVRRVIEQLAAEAESDLALVKEVPPPEGSGEPEGAPQLSKNAFAVLKYLAECAGGPRQGVRDITENNPERLSYNPVRDALKELSAAGLVHTPAGKRKGYAVTPQGMRLAEPK